MKYSILTFSFIFLLVSCKNQQPKSTSQNQSQNMLGGEGDGLGNNVIISEDDGTNLSIESEAETTFIFEGENNTIIFEHHNVLNLSASNNDTVVFNFSDKTIRFKMMNAVQTGFSNGMKITLTERYIQGDSAVFEYQGNLTSSLKLDLAERLMVSYFDNPKRLKAQDKDFAAIIMWAYFSEHDLGNSSATYELGRILYYGLVGQKANREKGTALLKEAARKDNTDAQDLLELMYETWD